MAPADGNASKIVLARPGVLGAATPEFFENTSSSGFSSKWSKERFARPSWTRHHLATKANSSSGAAADELFTMRVTSIGRRHDRSFSPTLNNGDNYGPLIRLFPCHSNVAVTGLI